MAGRMKGVVREPMATGRAALSRPGVDAGSWTGTRPRYRIAHAHRESRIREAIDVLCFVGLVFVTLFILSIADIR